MTVSTLRQRVLIADDEPGLRALVRDSLGDHYEVFEAATGVQAMHLAEAHRPDAVLLDVRLPGPDGLAVCRWLKASPRLADARVIVTSALAATRSALDGLDAGADYHLPKPFTPHVLRHLLLIACGE